MAVSCEGVGIGVRACGTEQALCARIVSVLWAGNAACVCVQICECVTTKVWDVCARVSRARVCMCVHMCMYACVYMCVCVRYLRSKGLASQQERNQNVKTQQQIDGAGHPGVSTARVRSC